MATRQITLPTTADLQTQYTKEINAFFGSDYTSTRLNASTYRAIDSKNYIRRNNALQKRWGYKQVANYGSGVKVHNLWSFKDKSDKTHYIANMSGSLYEINEDTFERTLIDNGAGAVLDREVSAFPTNNRLYILGGIKYLVLYVDEESEKLKLDYIVGSDFAYIPTTTIGITPTDSAINGYRQDLDSVNILTYWRKNRFISGLTAKENDSETITESILEYQLDTNISFKNEDDLKQMTLDIKFYDSASTQFEATDTTTIREAHFKAVKCGGLNLKGIDSTHTSEEIIKDDSVNGLYILVNYEEGDFNSSYESLIEDTILSADSTSGTALEFKIYGYIDLSGVVVLFNDYNNLNSDNNITFTFPCYNENTYQNNYIDTCFIGKVYNSNNINSLFVCGNPNFPARDWHTEEINSSALNEDEANLISTKDLVYFPDTSYCDYGEDNKNPILGYDVLGTGDLLVLKKYQNYEPTIYFRSGQLVKVTSSTGESLTDLIGSTLYEPQYSLTVGNISVSLNDYMKIVNYNGDTIFIGDDKKLEGLIKEDKAYDNQRYAQTRSYLIDAYLHDLDISNSLIYSDKGDCLYFINNNEMFVNKYNENATTDYMEWYHLTYDINITNMFKIGDKLYISSDKGGIYLFRNKNIYYDEGFINLNSGECLCELDTSYITMPQAKINECEKGNIIKLNEYAKIKLGTYGTDYKIDLENKKLIVLNYDLLPMFYNCSFISYQDKTLSIKRDEAFIFDITSDLTEISLNDSDIYLLFNEFVVKSVDLENSRAEIEEFEFASQLSTTGNVYYKRNVECYYITAPILFNDSYTGYTKNIHSILFTNDTDEQCETNVYLVDNKLGNKDNNYIVSFKDNKGIDYSNYMYGLINYERQGTLVKTQTISKKIYNKSYVMLKFFNDNNTNSVVSQVSITRSRGTRKL